MDVFNDLDNLVPQCAACNTSRDWETAHYLDEDDNEFEDDYGEEAESEYEDDEDNLLDDDFFAPDDCPTCGGEYEEKFNHLVCYHCMSQLCQVNDVIVTFDHQNICTSCGEKLRDITAADFMDTLT
jgi:hypothetical protein